MKDKFNAIIHSDSNASYITSLIFALMFICMNMATLFSLESLDDYQVPVLGTLRAFLYNISYHLFVICLTYAVFKRSLVLGKAIRILAAIPFLYMSYEMISLILNAVDVQNESWLALRVFVGILAVSSALAYFVNRFFKKLLKSIENKDNLLNKLLLTIRAAERRITSVTSSLSYNEAVTKQMTGIVEKAVKDEETGAYTLARGHIQGLLDWADSKQDISQIGKKESQKIKKAMGILSRMIEEEQGEELE